MNTMSTTPQLKPRDAERTRLAILTAAAEVFSESGFAGARVAQIAERAGVPGGLLYHYFDSKRTLFEAAMSQAFEPFAQQMLQLMQHADPSLELFEHVIRSYFGLLNSRPRLARMTAWWYASLGWVESPQPANAIWTAKQSAVKFVQRLKDKGEIRPDVDAEGVVLSILALCQHWHISHGENLHLLNLSAHQDPHEARLDQIVDIVMRGIKT